MYCVELFLLHFSFSLLPKLAVLLLKLSSYAVVSFVARCLSIAKDCFSSQQPTAEATMSNDLEVRDPVSQFPDYESYLASQISEQDVAYLDNEDTARQLIELGYRGTGDTLRREEWESRKKADKEKHLHRDVAPKPLASMGKEREMEGKPFLQALAAREELVRNGKLTVIIFIRDHNSKGQEVSGYIDYGARLKTDNFEAIFDGKQKLVPRPRSVVR